MLPVLVKNIANLRGRSIFQDKPKVHFMGTV